MAIKSIPQIVAPSFGGFVFALDFSMGYADSPSKLTYKVVSSSGTYTTPSIGSSCSVGFGDFSFDGRVFSYEIEESTSGKILSITLVDNSVILDKLYVVVFRPGLFGKNGVSSTASLPVVFTADDSYYDLKDNGSGFSLVKVTFNNGSVNRTVRSHNGMVGDLIIVGSEEPPDTKCEVASTSYTFNDLKGVVNVSGFSSCPITNSEVRKTYEGTLRSVLNSWCQDFGYSFYWDYRNNKIVFFDLKNSIFSIPDSVVDKSIISKKTLRSAEGKYNQLSANYFIKPYTPKSTNLSKSSSKWSGMSLSAIPWTYFIDKSLASGGTTKFGSGRSQSEFIESAVCGYLTPALRAIYNYSVKKKWGPACGFVGSNYHPIDAGQAASALTVGSYAEKMYNMSAFSGDDIEDLSSSYDCILVNYDVGIEEAWATTEQDIFTSKIGAYYYGPGTRSSDSTFCSATSIVSMSVSVDPEGTQYEDGDAKLDASIAGRKIFQRGGAGPSIPSQGALKQLGIDEGQEYISNLLPSRHDISSQSSVGDILLSYAIASKSNISKYNSIVFIPKKKLVDSYLNNFSVSYTTGPNDREQTANEIAAAQKPANQCTLKDLNEKKCLSAKQELQEAQRGAAEDQSSTSGGGVTGLSNKYGIGASVRANGAAVTVISSSVASYAGVITTSYSTEVLIDETKGESITFESDGVTSTSDPLIGTRFILENRSIADNLVKDKPTPSDLFSRVGYVQDEDLRTVTYTCSDFVVGLPIGQDSGITNLDISISDAGFSATYSYSTRPPVFGGQDLSRVYNGSNPSNPAIQIR